VGQVLPRHSVTRFAMRIVVPDYTPPGTYPLWWQVDEAQGPAATARTEITVTSR
jgi:hypothetical protein